MGPGLDVQCIPAQGVVPLGQLPASFQEALNASAGGTQTLDHDLLVGSLSSESGYCSYYAFRGQPYCACVNGPGAGSGVGPGSLRPECTYKCCANNELAYKTTAMRDSSCKDVSVVDCDQIVKLGGSDNVVSGLKLAQNCGGTAGGGAAGLVGMIKADPLLGLLFLIFVLSLAALIMPPKKAQPTPSQPAAAAA